MTSYKHIGNISPDSIPQEPVSLRLTTRQRRISDPSPTHPAGTPRLRGRRAAPWGKKMDGWGIFSIHYYTCIFKKRESHLPYLPTEKWNKQTNKPWFPAGHIRAGKWLSSHPASQSASCCCYCYCYYYRCSIAIPRLPTYTTAPASPRYQTRPRPPQYQFLPIILGERGAKSEEKKRAHRQHRGKSFTPNSHNKTWQNRVRFQPGRSEEEEEKLHSFPFLICFSAVSIRADACGLPV